MNKIKLILLMSVLTVLVTSFSVNAFITANGNEWSFIWGERESQTLNNGSIKWIARMDYGNGTINPGHLEYIFYNTYKIMVPYVMGVNINGNDYYKNYNFRNNRTMIKWNIPIGHRNHQDVKFDGCRPYEIQKGVCSENEI